MPKGGMECIVHGMDKAARQTAIEMWRRMEGGLGNGHAALVEI
jgi:hypothetical protein